MTGDQKQALQISVKAKYHNSAPFSIVLKQIVLAIEYEGVKIGTVSTSNVAIVAGQTSELDIQGDISRVTGVDEAPFLSALGALIDNLIRGDASTLTLRGVNALVDESGQSTSWLNKALGTLEVKASLEQPPMKIIESVDVSSVDVQLSSKHEPVIKVLETQAAFKVPYPIEVSIESASAQVEVLFDDHFVGSADIADSQIAEEPRPSNQPLTDSRKLRIDLRAFKLLPANNEVLSDMIEHVFLCDQSERISLRGKARATVSTAIGKLSVEVDLANQHIIRVQGLKGLQSSPVQYSDLQVVDANAQRLDVRFNLFLNNPSKSVRVTLLDSDLSMAAYFQGSYVGRAFVAKDRFDFPSGPLHMKDVHFSYEPKADEHMDVRKLPANFLSGEISTLEIRGDDQSTDIIILRKALKSLRLTFDLAALINKTLIDNITITLGLSMLTASSVDTSCEYHAASLVAASLTSPLTAVIVNNPLGATIDLLSLSFVARYKDQPFGESRVDFRRTEQGRVRVQPGTPQDPGQATGHCTVIMAQHLDKLVRTFIQSRGRIDLDVQLQAEVEIQGFAIPLFEYTQGRLPLIIKGLESVQKLLWVLPR